MASIAAGEDRSVSIGRVFSRAFGTIASNPVATLGIAFAFGALPSVLMSFVLQGFRSQSLDEFGGLAEVAVAIVTVVGSILLSMIAQGALVRATVAHSEGRQAGFGESAKAGLVVAIPLFLVGLLSGFGIMLGLIMLIVPGIMFYVIWSVAAPARSRNGSGRWRRSAEAGSSPAAPAGRCSGSSSSSSSSTGWR